jgi:hypothetical protein
MWPASRAYWLWPTATVAARSGVVAWWGWTSRAQSISLQRLVRRSCFGHTLGVALFAVKVGRGYRTEYTIKRAHLGDNRRKLDQLSCVDRHLVLVSGPRVRTERAASKVKFLRSACCRIALTNWEISWSEGTEIYIVAYRCRARCGRRQLSQTVQSDVELWHLFLSRNCGDSHW